LRQAALVEYSLRPALETESAVIRDLIHQVGINPMGLDWRRFLVAVTPEGQVIGCGQLKPHGGGLLELASIAVLPEHRKLGIARAVIEHLLDDSPRPLYLTCVSSMGPFYERFGFYALKPDEMPRYFRRLSQLAGLVFTLAQRGETLLVMKLQ
jgi:N-acetylglutamate synthase-like GNAT family acetyltransferase